MDPLRVGVEVDAGHHTLTLVGEVDIGARRPLMDLVDACVAAHASSVVFDMRDVTFAGSAALSVLVYAGARMNPRGTRPGSVRVLPSPQLLRALEATGLMHGAAGFVVEP